VNSSRKSPFRGQMLESRPSGDKRASYPPWLMPLVLGIATISVLGVKNHQNILGPDREYQAVLEAQTAIKQRFRDGMAVRFAPRELTKIDATRDSYTISGWLQAISRDGMVTEVYDYRCVVTESMDGGWSVTQLDLQPQ
jgi:hypothetical protein